VENRGIGVFLDRAHGIKVAQVQGANLGGVD
jgi:hypothetical protein